MSSPGSPRWHSLLRRKRELLGLSGNKLARGLAMTPSLYHAVEGRVRVCPLKWAFALADLHRCEIWQLFDEDGRAWRIQDVYDEGNQLLLEACS